MAIASSPTIARHATSTRSPRPTRPEWCSPGSEVKSLRAGRANLKDSFARIARGEAFLLNAHISPYAAANRLGTSLSARGSCSSTAPRSTSSPAGSRSAVSRPCPSRSISRTVARRSCLARSRKEEVRQARIDQEARDAARSRSCDARGVDSGRKEGAMTKRHEALMIGPER